MFCSHHYSNQEGDGISGPSFAAQLFDIIKTTSLFIAVWVVEYIFSLTQLFEAFAVKCLDTLSKTMRLSPTSSGQKVDERRGFNSPTSTLNSPQSASPLQRAADEEEAGGVLSKAVRSAQAHLRGYARLPRKSAQRLLSYLHSYRCFHSREEFVPNPSSAAIVFGALSPEGEAAVRNYCCRIRKIPNGPPPSWPTRIVDLFKKRHRGFTSVVEPTGCTVFACDSNLRLLQERFSKYPNVRCLLHQWSNRSDTERCKEQVMAAFKTVFAVVIVVPEDQRVFLDDVEPVATSPASSSSSPVRSAYRSLDGTLRDATVIQRFDEAFASPLRGSRDGSTSNASTSPVTAAIDDVRMALGGLDRYCTEDFFKFSVVPRALQPLRVAKAFIPLLVACEGTLREVEMVEDAHTFVSNFGRPRMILITSTSQGADAGGTKRQIPFGQDLDLNLMKSSLQQLQRAPFSKFVSMIHIHCERYVVVDGIGGTVNNSADGEIPTPARDTSSFSARRPSVIEGALLRSHTLNRILRHRNVEYAIATTSSHKSRAERNSQSVTLGFLEKVAKDERSLLYIRDLTPLDLLVTGARASYEKVRGNRHAPVEQ